MPTLNWIGKEKVINHHQDVPYKTLKEIYTFNNSSSENMIIHGDNLEVLKSLLPKYDGQIDFIYIDPPYNTGEEKWIYNDNVKDPKILKWLGQVVGKEGEDLSRHDKWLCMMYPRLKLMQKLLKFDGVIFVSISDIELYNLKLIMDEIFGSSNFVANIVREAIKGGSKSKDIRHVHDYILVYCKDKNQCVFRGIPTEGNILELEDENGPYTMGRELNKWGAGSRREDSPSMYFPIPGPNGEDVYPIRNDGSEGRWRLGKEKMMQKVLSGDVVFKKREDGTYIVYEKIRSSEPKEKQFTTLFVDKYMNSYGSDSLKKVFNTMMSIFDFSKPTELIESLIQFSGKKDAYILDCFAGSGTTAHSVLKSNKENGYNNKFINIEMNDYIHNITSERIKRVITGYGDYEGTGGDFSFYELGDSIFNEDGNINANIDLIDIKKYIYYTETQQELGNQDGLLLGEYNNTSYYLFYDKDESYCLNTKFLGEIKNKSEWYVIYADTCSLSKEFMKKYNIIFKKLPRDIIKY